MFAIGVNVIKLSHIKHEVEIQRTPLTVEVDTGAEVPIISDDTRKSCVPRLKLSKTNVAQKNLY